jgi:hypothetical protein
MGPIKDLLDEVGVNLALIIAGLVGSFVSVGNKKDVGYLGKFISIISGGAIANYMTPLLINVLGLNQNWEYGFAFVLGFMGLEGVRWIIVLVKDKFGVKNKENDV